MAFTQAQNGAAVTGSTTSITLTLPAPSTAGTLLVAKLVLGGVFPATITDVNGSGPNTSPGWEWCCTAVNGSGTGGQQAEIWCYRGNPGGITTTTWDITAAGACRGHMMEFSSALAWQVMELFPGITTATGAGTTSFPVSMSTPVGSGELAVALFGDNFSTGTANTWTTPSGWTMDRDTSGQSISNAWASYHKLTAAAGAVSVTGTASTSANQVGWEGALVVFRESAAVAARVGCSISPGTYNDQGSFGFSSTKTGSAKEFDVFVGRPMAVTAQVSYQHEGAHLTTGPTSDMNELDAMGAQICWATKPNRTGVSGFTTVAAEQAAVNNDLSLVKQSGINGWFCTSYNEYNMGGANGYFGNDTFKPSGDPYGSGNTDATAKQNWLTYWGHYQPVYAKHGIPIMTKPSYASAVSCSTWHPPAGTCSGVMADFYYSDSAGKTVYLDQSAGTDPATGNPAPSLQAVCDGTKNPDGTTATNTPVPLGIGETGRAGGSSTPAWSLVVAWSHTGSNTGHLRDLFKARLTAGKQNAPVLWFSNNIGGPNWIHTPGANGEDQTGIQAELAAWVDNLSVAATAPPPVVVTTTSLPNAVLGGFYSQALQVAGGSAPYTWALLTGALPTGLSLSAAGVISGTPNVAGTSTFTVKATDANSVAGNSGTLSILVPSLSVTTATLAPATVGVAYSQALARSGGTGPFTWAVTAGALPAGIVLSATGVLSGTTGAVTGAYPFTATVTDSLSNTASAALTLTVNPGTGGGGGDGGVAYGSVYTSTYGTSPSPPPPAPGPGFPRVIIEAGFYTPAPVAQPGTFVLDDPVNGVLDVCVLSDGTAWTDITRYVRSGTITRASTRVQGPLRTYQAGTASVTLRNDDARFDPDNLSGPYVTGGVSNIRPMVPVRVRAIWSNVEYHLFNGFVDTWTTPDANYGPQYAETTATAQDGFKVLTGAILPPLPPVGNNEPSGSRIRRILNDAGWFTDHRRIDDGGTRLQATPYGDTVLNLLQLAADTEIGELYVDGSGNLTFRERQAILTDTRSVTSQATFSDQPGALPYTGVGRADDDTTLANDVQITRAGSSNVQEAQDPASIAKYLFPRSYSRADVILQSDAEALAYAQWVLYVSSAGENRFDALTVTPLRDPNLWPHVLGREIGDRITVTRRPPGMAAITKDVFIRGITHTLDVSSNTWITSWDLQDASRHAGFLLLDDATLGKLSKGNRLAY